MKITQKEAEEIYLALDTASPISLTLTVNPRPIGSWSQAA
jgi:hypothetical protein